MPHRRRWLPSSSRRELLRGLVILLLAPMGALGYRLARQRTKTGRRLRLRVPAPRTDGWEFHEAVILGRDGDELTAWSARCPHLGCRIDRQQDGAFVCPCHGSRFSRDGQLLGGPATTGLTRLQAQWDADQATAIVVVED